MKLIFIIHLLSFDVGFSCASVQFVTVACTLCLHLVCVHNILTYGVCLLSKCHYFISGMCFVGVSFIFTAMLRLSQPHADLTPFGTMPLLHCAIFECFVCLIQSLCGYSARRRSGAPYPLPLKKFLNRLIGFL